MRIFLRYMIFQLPGMFVAGIVLGTLVRWGQLTEPLAWGLFALWIVKDLAFFPVTRIAYSDHKSQYGPDALVGSVATTLSELVPGEVSYVRLGPERWQALLVAGAAAVDAGTRVRVVELNGLTLQVEPE